MYPIITIISFIIRQFLLPNPFEPLGENAVVINLIASVVLIPVAYVMAGPIYRALDGAPGLGSLLFLLLYAANTMVIYFVCLAIAHWWLVIVILIIYVVLYAYFVNLVYEAL